MELACYRGPVVFAGYQMCTVAVCTRIKHVESEKCVTWSWSGYSLHVLTTHVIASDFD